MVGFWRYSEMKSIPQKNVKAKYFQEKVRLLISKKSFFKGL